MSDETIECEQWQVEQAQHDPEAFRLLYNLYLPRVYTYVGYRVSVQEETEDLVSEIFLHVVEELTRFRWRHSYSFPAWLFRIAHNAVANFHRDTARAGTPLSLDALPLFAANALLPEDTLLRKELFTHLHTILGELPARRREVITLRYFAGLRNQEIAEVLGIGERTVASTMGRALADMQARFKIAAADRNSSLE